MRHGGLLTLEPLNICGTIDISNRHPVLLFGRPSVARKLTIGYPTYALALGYKYLLHILDRWHRNQCWL